MDYISIKNNTALPLASVPEHGYDTFYSLCTGLVDRHPDRHCVTYHAVPEGDSLMLICAIADDATSEIHLLQCRVARNAVLRSFAAVVPAFERFEREIRENFGVGFTGHPWLKPVRYPFYRADQSQTIANYPFFSMEGDELHEVGVGPIHAGVIEPGHFRFICNGEQILHLEIQLGFQHRGVEPLFLLRKGLLQQTLLAESIAGDTAVGHTTAFCLVREALGRFETAGEVAFARTLALELERMAIHTGDMAALCTDIAYQLGNAVYGRLRTPLVNFFQEWGGNRLGKGVIRPGTNPFPFTPYLGERLSQVLDEYERDFEEMSALLFNLPSALSRFERTGVVSYDQLVSIGAVGMAARMGGLSRDLRSSHPSLLYPRLNHQPVVKHHGDVFSRIQIRREEIRQSVQYLRQLISEIPERVENDPFHETMEPGMVALSLVEGWRGEICHFAVTDDRGELLHYKVKDPSFHNWMALALAVRNNEISDFPICNKSFNLSYCGHDL